MSRRRDSDPRSSAYHAAALPLCYNGIKWWKVRDLNPSHSGRPLHSLRYHLSVYLGHYPDVSITSHKMVRRVGVEPTLFTARVRDLQSRDIATSLTDAYYAV